MAVEPLSVLYTGVFLAVVGSYGWLGAVFWNAVPRRRAIAGAVRAAST